MLPSRGFFKKNDCPFFEKGLCVRPHCHFRHRKKAVSESLDSQEDSISSEKLPDIPLVNSINNENASVTTSSTSGKEIQHSRSTDTKENESNQGSLFAKLVNQSNPYEKISRHIPCAYTPTPQTRSVQPKNKTVSAKNSINKSAINTVVTNPSHTVLNNYSSVHDKQKIVQKEEIFSVSKNLLSEQNNQFSRNSQNGDSKVPEIASYEPQSTNCNNINKNTTHGDVTSYVPSKVISGESKYVPDSSDSSVPKIYVPSKDKPKRVQYVPEPTGDIKNQVAYKPSDKTSSGETQYQPGSSGAVADYVPTEKSATKAGSLFLDEKKKGDLTEFEFISSEIEMMKKLLDEDWSESNEITSKSVLNTESVEKEKKSHKENEKSSRSHSSKHRSDSKSRHSSSSSRKHSSRSSGSSSRHHSSSSSRHHSSRKSSKSDSHRSSSDSHRKRSSSSRSHQSSHRSRRSRSKEKSSREKKEKERSHSEKKKHKEVSSSEEDGNEAMDVSNCDSSEQEADSGNESETGSKKRKYDFGDDERAFKYLKKSKEELFDDLEEDPDTVEKQCLEIFNSYSNSIEKNDLKNINEGTALGDEFGSSTLGKKRTAHFTSTMSDHSVLREKTAKKTQVIKSAQEVMLERYKSFEKTKETQPVQPSPILGLNRPSIRIAAVSNIQQMLKAKEAIYEKIKSLTVKKRTTTAQTACNKNPRVAHTPSNKEMLSKPTVTTGSKQVPRVKRQIYLDKLLLETNKIFPTKEEAAGEALRLEEEVFQANSGSSSAYNAAFISMLMKTRRRVAVVQGETSSKNFSRPTMSHSEVLSGGKRNFSVIKSKKVELSMLSERHIYDELLRCKLTPEELKENSYPMDGNKPGFATCAINFNLKYNDKYLYIKKLTGNRRYCVRCSKQYEVDPETLQQYKEGPETCHYHPGKKKSGGRNSERIYNCCNTASSEGCATHIRHVTDCNDYENLPNCVKTLSKGKEKNPGVYALDCEMVYTRMGYELARVTVVNVKKEIVYDTLVKPKYPIECYNTFYSGIEEKMMEGVQTTLKDVQAVLLSMFSDKTILIGHSLDSDLRALHLIHETVVDTAVFYKNEKYHPYKYSLKDLCARKINKIIQENVTGHDSAEDAIAALEIMLNHVKEEVSKYDCLESYEADRAK